MNLSMSRHMILAVMVSALLVTVLATSNLAFQPSDSSCPYRLASAAGSTDSKGMEDLGVSQPPAGNRQDMTKADSGGTALPECYQSCMTDKSGVMRSLCWLGCDYRPDGPPWVP